MCVCVLSLRWMLNRLNDIRVLSASLVDMKNPMVSFVKSRQAIAGTVNKLQIPAISSSGHCISGTAMSSVNDTTLQHCPAYEQTRIPFLWCQMVVPMTH